MEQYEIIQHKNLVFILTDEKVIVRTSLGQQFYLSPRRHYSQRKIKLIRLMLQFGEIKNLDDLSGSCENGEIEWLPTYKDYSFVLLNDRSKIKV